MSRVVMFVANDATRDSRVLREAETLTASGHRVAIVALPGAGEEQAPVEPGRLFELIRVPVPSDWRVVWAWIRDPWRVRGRAVAALKRSVRGGPSRWPRAVAIGLGVGLSSPWIVIRGLLSVAHRLPERRPGLVDRWLTWRLGSLGWARAAGRRAPPADVYHGHDLIGLAAAVEASDRRGGFVVYDSHEIFLESGGYVDLPGWLRRSIARLERRLAKRAEAVVTVNPEIGRELERRFPVRRLVVVHNCPPRWTPPDPPEQRLRLACGIPAGAPILLYHGVFTTHRGLTQLADAALEPGLESAHVVYLGYGRLRPEIDALVADPRFGGRLHVLDAVPPSELLDWVTGADVVVIPGQRSTLNHWLSSPNKLFEALAAGVPVAIMDFPYVRGIVLDDPVGPLGTVCDPADPASIARAVREILELSARERQALRARCLTAAHERWNWESESARLVDLYADLEARANEPPASASNRGAGTSQPA